MKTKSTLIYIAFISCILISRVGYGQVINDLNQKITIEASNITIAELLLEIGQKAKIKFSYNPKVINADKRISITGNRKAVREILNQVFEDRFIYKLRGEYVIIVDDKLTEERSNSRAKLISGYVVDDETLNGLSNVSIYTSAGENVITDEIGAFKIKLKSIDNSTIELRKKNFHPLSFATENTDSDDVQINMKPIKSVRVVLERDSIKQVGLPTPNKELKTMYKVNTSLKMNLENIPDTLYKPISLSLYPGISTYGNLSGNIIYGLALNFVGYNRGIKGTEFALLSNINKDYVQGTQLAGLSNYTGGNVDGFQAAGIFNNVNGDLSGVQMGGITNVNGGNIIGSQFAGISNHVGKDLQGLQMAGILNKSGSFSGAQLSGVINLAKAAKGVQIAGIYNFADTLRGTQISGILNKAKYVKGHQVGLINVAESISGISFGLINFIKKGYKRIEFSTDELFPVNLSLKTGVPHFYTILTAGMQTGVFDDESAFYTFGFGLGTSRKLSKALNFDFTVINRHITKKAFTDQLSFNLQGYLGLELKVFEKLTLMGGGVYNFYYFDRELLEDSDFDQLRNSYLTDNSDNLDNSVVWRSWIGYKFGMRYVF